MKDFKKRTYTQKCNDWDNEVISKLKIRKKSFIDDENVIKQTNKAKTKTFVRQKKVIF